MVAIGLIFVQIPNSHQPRTGTVLQTLLTKLDLMGFAIFAPSLIQLLLALEWGGNTYAWNSATTIGLFCGAGCMFIIFLLWERRKGEEAMIPLSLLRNRVVGIICGVVFFFFAMMQLVTYYLPIYFQAVRGDSPLISGVHLLPSILNQLLAILFFGAAGKCQLRSNEAILEHIMLTHALISSHKTRFLYIHRPGSALYPDTRQLYQKMDRLSSNRRLRTRPRVADDLHRHTKQRA